MRSNFGRGIREGAIAGAAGGFAGNWLVVIGIVVSAQFSGGGGATEFLQSLLLGIVIGFVGTFIGTPIGALIGAAVGGLYGVLRIERSAPVVTAVLLGGALPIAELAAVGGGAATAEGTTAAQWAFGLLVVGLLAGLGYGSGRIWRNGMRSRSAHASAAPDRSVLAGVGG